MDSKIEFEKQFGKTDWSDRKKMLEKDIFIKKGRK